jgi:rubrerythrin
MVRDEERRLVRAFEKVIALSLATTGAVGCSSRSAVVHTQPDAGAHAQDDAGVRDAAGASDATMLDGSGGLDGAAADDAMTSEDAAAPDDGGARDDAAAMCADGSAVFLDGGTDDSGCDYVYWMNLPCGLPDAATENCFLTLAVCSVICGRNVTCQVAECTDAGAGQPPIVQTTGSVDVVCSEQLLTTKGCIAVGRRPDGLAEARASKGGGAAAWLAASAYLEEASIVAFEQLADNLEAFAAPRELVDAARRSARDEVRHARTMRSLARRRGASQGRPVVATPRRRASLLGLAIENAVEGCVRETFGALIAVHQAARATDRSLAVAMARIARDETRHAALAWSLAQWVEQRLDTRERAQVTAARRAALRVLQCEMLHANEEDRVELGLPTRAEAARMLECFGREVVDADADADE